MSRSQAALDYGHGGSDGEPPEPKRHWSLPLWMSGVMLGLMAVAYFMGWMGLPLALGGIAWCLAGARLTRVDANPASLDPFAPKVHRYFSTHAAIPEDVTDEPGPGLIHLNLRRRRLQSRTADLWKEAVRN